MLACACGSRVDDHSEPPGGDQLAYPDWDRKDDVATRVVVMRLSYQGAQNDLDLIVYQPNGVAVDEFATGGSTAKWAQLTDGESITWPSGEAATGDYELFILPFWVETKLPYTLRVEVDGVELVQLEGEVYPHQEDAMLAGVVSL